MSSAAPRRPERLKLLVTCTAGSPTRLGLPIHPLPELRTKSTTCWKAARFVPQLEPLSAAAAIPLGNEL